MGNNEIKYTVKVDGDISNLEGSLGKVEKSIKDVGGSAKLDKALSGDVEKITKNLEELDVRSKKTITSMTEMNKVTKAADNVSTSVDKLNRKVEKLKDLNDDELSEFLPQDIKKQLEDGAKAVQKYEQETIKATKEIDKQKKKLQELKTVQDNVNKALEAEKRARKVGKTSEGKKIVSDAEYGRLTSAKNKAQTSYNAAAAKVEEFKSTHKMTKNGQVDKRSTNAVEDQAIYDKLIADLNAASKKFEEAKRNFDSSIGQSRAAEDFKKLENEVTKAANNVQNKTSEITKLETDTSALENLKKAFQDLGIDASSLNSVEDFKNALNGIKSDNLVKTRDDLDKLGNELNETSSDADKLKDSVDKAAYEFKEMVSAAKGMEQVTNNLMQFFGLQNIINLFQRALRDTFQTVKDLDAAMTEIAVVSDFGVGDMWNRLPQMSKNASALGVSINDAYKATTLYVQQGLSFNDSLKLSNQTLKMARIAGMDAASATDAMTAALRGFNMEIDEDSAQRVSDVYSKLAAITAADTGELSTAMSKVASIANSANMELETTSAFLAQIIETTREAPETA